jgi:hypothetical protein
MAQCISKRFITGLSWLLNTPNWRFGHSVISSNRIEILESKYTGIITRVDLRIALFDVRCPDVGRQYVRAHYDQLASFMYDHFYIKSRSVISDLDRVSRYIIKWQDMCLLGLFVSIFTKPFQGLNIWPTFMALKCLTEGKLAITKTILGVRPLEAKYIINTLLDESIFDHEFDIYHLVIRYLDIHYPNDLIIWAVEKGRIDELTILAKKLKLRNVKAQLAAKGLWRPIKEPLEYEYALDKY